MPYMTLATSLVGEKKVMTEILKVMPLIEEYLKPLDGEKALIASGMNAKFRKVFKAFKEACSEVSDANIYLNSTGMSLWLETTKYVKALESDCSGDYFKESRYIGKFDTGDWNREGTGAFTYEFDAAECKSMINRVLNTDIEEMNAAKAKIAAMKKEIESLADSFHYSFKDYLIGRR